MKICCYISLIILALSVLSCDSDTIESKVEKPYNFPEHTRKLAIIPSAIPILPNQKFDIIFEIIGDSIHFIKHEDTTCKNVVQVLVIIDSSENKYYRNVITNNINNTQYWVNYACLDSNLTPSYLPEFYDNSFEPTNWTYGVAFPRGSHAKKATIWYRDTADYNEILNLPNNYLNESLTQSYHFNETHYGNKASLFLGLINYIDSSKFNCPINIVNDKLQIMECKHKDIILLSKLRQLTPNAVINFDFVSIRSYNCFQKHCDALYSIHIAVMQKQILFWKENKIESNDLNKFFTKTELQLLPYQIQIISLYEPYIPIRKQMQRGMVEF